MIETLKLINKCEYLEVWGSTHTHRGTRWTACSAVKTKLLVPPCDVLYQSSTRMQVFRSSPLTSQTLQVAGGGGGKMEVWGSLAKESKSYLSLPRH